MPIPTLALFPNTKLLLCETVAPAPIAVALDKLSVLTLAPAPIAVLSFP